MNDMKGGASERESREAELIKKRTKKNSKGSMKL